MLLELKLKDIRVKNMKKLNEKNLRVFNAIMVYMGNSDLRKVEKEEIYQQVLDMFLEAQLEDKEISMIIGDDYEIFCKSIIDEYVNNRNMLYKILFYIQRYLIGILGITLLMSVFNQIFWHKAYFGIDVNLFIIANLIVLILNPLSRKRSQKGLFLYIHPKSNYRINIEKESMLKGMLVYFAAAFGINFIAGELFGPDVYSQKIILIENIPYIIMALIIIVVIEVYKRIVDKK